MQRLGFSGRPLTTYCNTGNPYPNTLSQLSMKNVHQLVLVYLLIVIGSLMNPAHSRDHAGQAILVDVRSEAEWKAGHVQNAVWIPWRDIENGIARLGVEKDKPILLYCEQGVRAELAEQILKQAGYKRVSNLINVSEAARVTGQSIIRSCRADIARC